MKDDVMAGQVAQELDELSEALALLGEGLERHGSCLECVLMPPTPTMPETAKQEEPSQEADDGPYVQPLAPLVGCIRAHKHTVFSLCASLEDLTQRLAV